VQRARLTHTKLVLGEVGQAANAAAGAVRQARLGLRLTSLLGAVVGMGTGVIRRRAEAVAVASEKAALTSALRRRAAAAAEE
jgi:hypothetical protein